MKKEKKIACDNLRGESLIEVTTLLERDLHICVYNEHLLSGGGVVRVEGKEGATS